jgi:hypothetical protein
MDVRATTIDFMPFDAETRAGAQLPESKHDDHGKFSSAHRQLAALNLRYLDILAGEHDSSDPIVAGVRELSPAEKLAIAQCPFSLFTLRFEQADAWLHLSTYERRCAHEPISVSAARADWISTAVFFAWHLVHVQPLAAQLLLGMNMRVAEILRHVPVSGLTRLAEGAHAWVAPRWPRHPHFWPSLFRNGRNGDALLQSSFLMGRQLFAAEALQAIPFETPPPRRNVRRIAPQLSTANMAFA